MKPWPKVRLGEVLQRSEEIVEPQGDKEYREITVRLWGKGVVERGRILGASLSGRRFVARAGQFIASRIDARYGAMGRVPESLDGALVTNDLPLFNLKTERLEPVFLGWLCRTAGFVELCLRASEGTTNRVRLKEERFLALEISLPPLAEQRRMVARIEDLAAQIHDARTLRHQAAEEAEALGATASSRRCREIEITEPLGSLIANGTSISYGVLVPGPEVEDGIPFIRIQDLAVKNAPERPSKRISPAVERAYARTRLKGGEVLLAVVGATIGKVGVAPDSIIMTVSPLSGCRTTTWCSWLILTRRNRSWLAKAGAPNERCPPSSSARIWKSC